MSEGGESREMAAGGTSGMSRVRMGSQATGRRWALLSCGERGALRIIRNGSNGMRSTTVVTAAQHLAEASGNARRVRLAGGDAAPYFSPT